jgi:histidinol-phosphate phosphatase family protein
VPYLSNPALVRPVPHAERLLRELRSAGLKVGVISNQSGIARGLITPAQLRAVNQRVEQLLGPFDTWQLCQHAEGDGCECRKPLPGLIVAAAEALGVKTAHCVVIGDIGADVDAALAAGAKAIMVPTHKTRAAEIARAKITALVAPDLEAAVALALAGVS